MVVLTSVRRSNSWIVRMSYPPPGKRFPQVIQELRFAVPGRRLSADLRTTTIAAFCFLLPEERTFMVPARVVQNYWARAISGARLVVHGTPS
jgi:hypothetical protein